MASEKEVKQRTLHQNRALHKLFGMLAETLNESGNDMRKTLKEGVDIPWNSDTVKEYLWRPIQKAQLQKDSTTELTTKDIDAVFETLNRHLGEKLGIHTPFPSVEEIIQTQLGRKKML
jgi:hypothetical protein